MPASARRRLRALAQHSAARQTVTHTGSAAALAGHDESEQCLAEWRPRGWKDTVAPLKYVHTRPIPLEDMATAGVAALEECGFCVVSGVLSVADCSSIADQLWTTIEGLGKGIARDDVSSQAICRRVLRQGPSLSDRLRAAAG